MPIGLMRGTACQANTPAASTSPSLPTATRPASTPAGVFSHGATHTATMPPFNSPYANHTGPSAPRGGPLARVKIDVGADDHFVYKISCAECVAKGDRKWSTYRAGEDNGFMAAMDRWTFHLTEKHPDSDAPCLAFLPEAQQRLHERREQQG